MKTRNFSFLSLAAAFAALTSGSALLVGGCGGGGGGGGGGSGGGTPPDPANLISDFEDTAAATVVQAGTPPRNGYWYTYNDDNPAGTDTTCMQVPPSGPQRLPLPPATYVGSAPAAGVHAGSAGSFALEGKWSGCSIWGAGIGADLNQPMVADGGTYTGSKVEYDVTSFTGVTFWAMAVSGTDTHLRLKFPMSDETKLADGGKCDEAIEGTGKCSDDFGEQFNLPTNGTWKQFTIKWSDAGFKQEGWGKAYTWNPAHVTSLQFQAVDKGETYDFFIDDVYFVK
jgi:hypothetical protein